MFLSHLNTSMQGEETTKQTEELLGLIIDFDRNWYDDDDIENSQNRVVQQLKSSHDSSKYLG